MSTPSTHADRWTIPAAGVGDVLASSSVRLVDLRSPAEYAEDHLPGAVNHPLFDNAERALIGTLYKQASPQAAFDEARELVLANIRSLVDGIAAAAGRAPVSANLDALVRRLTEGGFEQANQALEIVPVAALPTGALVVHCWRGGMRSASVARLLRELGWSDVFLLEGGYKSYRKHVLAALETWTAPPSFVLRGSTGVGKTLVLREIERLRPGWTLDLELHAGHRSSILGMVGLSPCNQKTFDTRIATRLREGFPGPCVIEGESRKVGDSIVPASVWRALKEGTHLRLSAPIDYRVKVLIDDYLATEESRAELRGQLPFIEKRLGETKWTGELVALLDGGREAELVEILLERYYDPLYGHSEKDYEYSAEFDASEVERVAAKIVAWIEQRSDA